MTSAVPAPQSTADLRPLVAAGQSPSLSRTSCRVLRRLLSVAAARVRCCPAAALPFIPLSPVASCVSRSPVFFLPPTPLRFVTLERSTPLQLLVEDNAADERLHCHVEPTLAKNLSAKSRKRARRGLSLYLTADSKPTLRLSRLLRLSNSQKRHYVNVDKQRSVPASTILAQVGAGVDAKPSH